MEFFDRQWATYRRVVDLDLMEHRGLCEATRTALEGWLAARPAAAPARMVDLGCGDLALLTPLLRQLPLDSYLGVDLCGPVLPRAAAGLGAVPYPCGWREQDLLTWALDDTAGEPDGGGTVDLIHTSFAVHHLDDGDKARFLAAARRRLAPGGLMLWADVFRQAGESLGAYVERYVARIHRDWGALAEEQRQQVIDHLSQFDRPADGAAIQAAAEACGWRWEWLWRGSHRAEALARLTPIA